MLDTAEPQDPTATPTEPVVVRWKSPAAAFISALIPGLGQLIVGMRGRATLLFVLDGIWVLLFFPPLRLPGYYRGWLCLVLAGMLISITACCDALRSECADKRPGSYLWLLGIVPTALIIPLVAQTFLLSLSGFRDFRIASDSMAPALLDRDLIMADMHSYRHRRPHYGEIILFRKPADPALILIKRVIATGGETISCKDGTIWRNGSPINEPYVRQSGGAPEEMMNFGPITIPANELFVMGDSRDISLDSRAPEFGPIPESVVQGKALYVITSAHSRDGESFR